MFKTPVVLNLFCRPERTRQVLNAIRPIRPEQLLAVCDGPRQGDEAQAEQCQATLRVLEEIDWPCRVLRNISPVNLGCGRRQASGLEWVFENVEEAIFLEDDCCPDPSFLLYASQLLQTYRHEPQVMTISGFNPLAPWRCEQQSYHFSRYGSHWGWATWKRAWVHYDFEMRALNEPETAGRLEKAVDSPALLAYLRSFWRDIQAGRCDTWDGQWTLAQLLGGGWSVVSSVNLISNTGFGAQATHTRQSLALAAHQSRSTLDFPLRAPARLALDDDYDRSYAAYRVGRPESWLVLARVEESLRAGRNSQALLLAKASLQSPQVLLTPQERERLLAVCLQAEFRLRESNRRVHS